MTARLASRKEPGVVISSPELRQPVAVGHDCQVGVQKGARGRHQLCFHIANTSKTEKLCVLLQNAHLQFPRAAPAGSGWAWLPNWRPGRSPGSSSACLLASDGRRAALAACLSVTSPCWSAPAVTALSLLQIAAWQALQPGCYRQLLSNQLCTTQRT